MQCAWKIETFQRIAQTPAAVAVRIAGQASPISGIAPNDRLCVAWGDQAEKETTLADGREGFTFTGYAFIRVGPDEVRAAGDIRSMKLAVPGTPKLLINGRPAKAAVAGGVMTYQAQAGK